MLVLEDMSNVDWDMIRCSGHASGGRHVRWGLRSERDMIRCLVHVSGGRYVRWGLGLERLLTAGRFVALERLGG